MLLELGADLGQRGRQSPIFEWSAIAQGAGLLHQHRQVMPGIVDDLIAPEHSRMVGDHLVPQQHDNAFGVRAHQHHPAGSARIDAVAIMVGHDQASGAGPHSFLDEPVEWAAQLHQARAFVLEHLPDRPVFELRVLGPLRVGNALIFQPRIQLGEALHSRFGPEHLVAQIADLVLDLTLLPSGGRRAGYRFDQMVRAHLQKASIVSARLTDEDRFDRRLHVVVDAAPAGPTIEPERLVMGVEHQLLGLAKVDAHKRHAAVRQLHVRRLDRQRQARKRDRLVAPVELVGFPRREAHRHIGMHRNPDAFIAPSFDEPMHTVVGAVIAAPPQLLEQSLRRPAFPLRQLGFVLQNLRQNLDPIAKLGRGLNPALVFELGLLATHDLAHRRP